MNSISIISLTFDQLASKVSCRYGKGRYHSAALYREILQKGNANIPDIPQLASSKALAARLSRDIEIPSWRIITQQDGDVVKFATILHDSNAVESVIIPSNRRTTLCVSSQAGCRMKCAFCATGAAGFVRNLSAEEIVGQVYTARFILKRNIDNIVFMGMGEPLDNFDEVVQAIRVISDQRGLNIPHRSITVSTAGHADGLGALGVTGWPHIRLAISINAADNVLRTSLMPITKIFTLEIVRKRLQAYPLARGGVFFIEYVLLAGVNDSYEMAQKLVCYLDGIPSRVNLIPFNESPVLPFRAPSSEKVLQFKQWLVEKNIFVRLRLPHGSAIRAACGQLSASLVNK